MAEQLRNARREARRKRIIELHREGVPRPQIAKRVGVSYGTVLRVIERHRATCRESS